MAESTYADDVSVAGLDAFVGSPSLHTVTVLGIEAIDGTPIVDIKPVV